MKHEPRIFYARWAPVTAGEYHPATNTIVVNLAVVDAVVRTTGHGGAVVQGAIVAHERAHAAAPSSWSRQQEEAASRAAAVAAAGDVVVLAIEDVLRRTAADGWRVGPSRATGTNHRQAAAKWV